MIFFATLMVTLKLCTSPTNTISGLTDPITRENLSIRVRRTAVFRLRRRVRGRRLASRRLIRFCLGQVKRCSSDVGSVVAIGRGMLRRTGRLSGRHGTKGIHNPLRKVPIVLGSGCSACSVRAATKSLSLRNSVPLGSTCRAGELESRNTVVLKGTGLRRFTFKFRAVDSLNKRACGPCSLAECPNNSDNNATTTITSGFTTIKLKASANKSVQVPSSFGGLIKLHPAVKLTDHSKVVPLTLSRSINKPVKQAIRSITIILSTVTNCSPTSPIARTDVKGIPGACARCLGGGKLGGTQVNIVHSLFKGSPRIGGIVSRIVTSVRTLKTRIFRMGVPDLDPVLSCPDLDKCRFGFRLGSCLTNLKPSTPMEALSSVVRDKGFRPDLRDKLGSQGRERSLRGSRRCRSVVAGHPGVTERDLVMAFGRRSLSTLLCPASDTLPTRINGDRNTKGTGHLDPCSKFPTVSIPTNFDSGNLPIKLRLLKGRFSRPALVGLTCTCRRKAGRQVTPRLGWRSSGGENCLRWEEVTFSWAWR